MLQANTFKGKSALRSFTPLSQQFQTFLAKCATSTHDIELEKISPGKTLLSSWSWLGLLRGLGHPVPPPVPGNQPARLVRAAHLGTRSSPWEVSKDRTVSLSGMYSKDLVVWDVLQKSPEYDCTTMFFLGWMTPKSVLGCLSRLVVCLLVVSKKYQRNMVHPGDDSKSRNKAIRPLRGHRCTSTFNSKKRNWRKDWVWIEFGLICHPFSDLDL